MSSPGPFLDSPGYAKEDHRNYASVLSVVFLFMHVTALLGTLRLWEGRPRILTHHRFGGLPSHARNRGYRDPASMGRKTTENSTLYFQWSSLSCTQPRICGTACLWQGRPPKIKHCRFGGLPSHARNRDFGDPAYEKEDH